MGKSASKDIQYAQDTVDAWLDGMTTAISNAQKRKAQGEQRQEVKAEKETKQVTSTAQEAKAEQKQEARKGTVQDLELALEAARKEAKNWDKYVDRQKKDGFPTETSRGLLAKAVQNVRLVEKMLAKAQKGDVLSSEELATLDSIYDNQVGYNMSSAKDWKAFREQAGQQAETKVSYSLNETTSGRPVAVIDTDILDGVPKKDWVKTVKETLKKLYPNGIKIKNSEILITRRTGREYTWSKYSQRLRKEARNVYADKLRTVAYADDILRASTDYVNEPPDHPRNDNFVDFGRGKVLFQIGRKSYSADVIVGYTNKGEMELYDLVNIAPANFSLKTPLDYKASDTSILIPSADASGSREGATYTDSMPDSTQNVKGKFSLNDTIEETRDLIAVHNLSGEQLANTIALGGFPMPSIAVMRASQGHERYGDISVLFNKDTIDPQLLRSNKVYGGDAWTPTFPKVEYETDSNATSRVSRQLSNLGDRVDKYFHSDLRRAAYVVEDTLNRYGGEEGVVQAALGNYGLMAAYLEEQGRHITPITKQETVGKPVSADMEATYEAVDSAIDKRQFEAWVRNLFQGVEKSKGLYNGKELFTSAGNRRSFSALHYEYNLENIVRAMKVQAEKGQGAWGSSGLFAVATKDYKSINEIRADKERLTTASQEEYQKQRDVFANRLQEIAHEIEDKTAYNSFIAFDDAIQVLLEAAQRGKTVSGMKKILEQYKMLNVKEDTAARLYALVREVENMPTEYFEAKPQRAVGMDEVKLVVLPKGQYQELESSLSELGIPVETYDPTVEGDRTRVLNGATARQYMFSLNDSFRTDQAIRKVLGKAVEGEIRASRARGRRFA